jgi:tRNA A58 N-methylase Trm61
MDNKDKDFKYNLSLEQATEWRYPIWAPAISFTLKIGAKHLGPGSRILELGYNSGLMSIYLAKHYGLQDRWLRNK